MFFNEEKTDWLEIYTQYNEGVLEILCVGEIKGEAYKVGKTIRCRLEPSEAGP